MAQSEEREYENYIRIGWLLIDIGSTTAKKKLRSIFLTSNLQDILANNRHTLYHLWNDKKCCQCIDEDLSGKPLVLDDGQWNTLFTSHPPVCNVSCSCSYTPVPGVTIDSFGLTLTLHLLENVGTLNPDELSYINGIQNIWRHVVSASSTWRVSDADFAQHWSALSINMTRLAGTCSPAIQRAVEEEIETLKSEDNNPEAENYYRLITLITDVGSSVLRDKFMDQFPNQIFEDILNDNKHDIYHLWKGEKCCSCGSRNPRTGKKPIVDWQWNLLFTQAKSNCCSQCCCCWTARQGVNVDDTDVTLISCLLMNIAKLNTNERDLVKEIRVAKNSINSHSTKVEMSDVDFKRQWDNVSHNIEILVKTFKTNLRNCPQYIDNTLRKGEKVKTKILDSSFKDRILKLHQETQRNPAMRKENKGEEENTAAVLDAVQGKKANWRDELTKACELSLKYIQLNTKPSFVRTRAFRLALEKITEGNRFIMFLGLSGDGKTTHAIHLMEEVVNGKILLQEKKRPLILHRHNHFKKLKLISHDENLIIAIDDMFGIYSAPLQTIDKWEGYYPDLKVWFADPPNSASNYLIVTMRKDIYNICKESLKNLEIYSKCIIIDMTSPDLCLHEEEKIKIFRTLIPQTCVDDDKLQLICKGNKQIGFPQCCRVFSKYPEFQNSAESFFQDPIACLRSDLKKMFYGLEEERQRFCVLALLAFHGGCLKFRHCYEHSCSEQDIQRLKHAAIMCGIRYSDIIGNKLLDDAKSFVGVYVECDEQKDEYTFSHSSVEETIVNLMFERNTELMISSCKFSFFSHFTQKQKRSPDTFSPKEKHYDMIVARILREVEIHKHSVFSELAEIDLWRDDQFRAKVSQKLHFEDFGLNYHMQGGRNDSMSLLVCGSMTGNFHLVDFLRKFKLSNNQLQRALDVAGRYGREKVFRLLLKSGAQPNIGTFFHIIKSGDINLFQYIMSLKDIDFSAKCDLEFPGHPISVFDQICFTGNQRMAELFRSRFQISFDTGAIKQYLLYCGYGGSAQIFYYIEKQCPKFLRRFLSIGELNPACLSPSLDQVKYMFKNYHYQPETTDGNGWTNLHSAALGGSVDVVKYLIENGVNVTEVTKNKMSVLLLACQECHIELVKYLVENHEGLLQMVDDNGLTSLHHAGIGGSIDVVKYLIENGVNVTDVTKNKRSVLLLACKKCHIELVKYLVENHRILLQMVDDNGTTSLHYAGIGGSVDVVKYLIEKGMNVEKVTKKKTSVLHLACDECHHELVKYLVENHPRLLQMVDDDGLTSLHHAGIGGSIDVVKYLIEKGVDVTEVTKNKITVLLLACQKCHIELVKYLVENHEGLLQMVADDGLTSLHHAGIGGSVDVVKYLIENGVNVTEVTKNKMSVLLLACTKCHLDLVKYLVEKHPSLLQMVDDNGTTSLHHAGIGGSIDVVKYLIENGVNVTEVTKNKMSVLLLACQKCHIELVKYLVENHRSLLQMVDDNGLTSLHRAGIGGSVDVVKYLIEKGMNVEKVSKKKTSVLHVPCVEGHYELVKYLVEKHPRLLQMVDDDGLSSLHHAGIGGSVDVVKYLIEKGMDVEKVSKKKTSVLHVPCVEGHYELVKYLVENHPRLLQMVDDDGLTSLHHAGIGGSVAVVKYLIEKGVDVTEVTKNKITVLLLACKKCHLDLVKYLVEKHPSLLQMVDDNGTTSLHHAGIGGSIDVVKYLIENGVNVTEVTKNKITVLLLACQKCHIELVKYLVENHRSLLQMEDDNGLTSLHHAGIGGSVDVVKYLIEKGVDVTEVTKNKMSVLLLACQTCHIELVKYLVENHEGLLQMVDDNGLTSLHHAGIGGSIDVVKYLIENGVNVTDVTKNKITVLLLACKKCHLDLVKYLVEKHPSLLQMVDDNGTTSLHHAGIGGSIDVVKYLIENGVNVTEVTKNKITVLLLACQKCHIELVKYLVENHRSLLQMEDDNGLTSLQHAGIGGSVHVVKYLIEKGMDVEKVTKKKTSVLHVACDECHYELVKYLVENHPRLLQMVDDDGLSSLHHAGIGGSVDVVKYLIENGVNVTEVTNSKMSLLHLACNKCHNELVKYLVENHPSLLQMVDDNGLTVLHHAGIGGSIDVVKYLIENGVNVTEVTNSKMSVLHLACNECHYELVKYLVENHPSLLQMVDDNGSTVLHQSAIGGSVDVVKYLIEFGMNIEEVTLYKMSVLLLACLNCHHELVKYLVQNYANLLKMRDDNGLTGLHHAGAGGSVDVVKYLIDTGVNVKEVTNDKSSVLHIACISRHYELVKYLVENHPSLLQMVLDNGLTVLHNAGIGGSVCVVKYLIENGVNVTEVNKGRMSVLLLACQKCNIELVKYLVENHPSLLEMVDDNGLTVLQHAGIGGSVDVVKYLIEFGMNIEEVTLDRRSVLHLACDYCHHELVKYLVQNYANLLKMRDDNGLTGLHHAGAGGSVDVVKYLIDTGVNVKEVTNDKSSVLHIACISRHYELVKYLVENHPSLLQMVHDNGLTVLHHAGIGGSVGVVKCLIENGVNVKEVTNDKRSVLHIACNKCHYELVKYLVENHPSLLQMIDDNGWTSLHHAGIGGSVHVVKYLIENGVDPTVVAKDKRSLLHFASQKCHFVLVKYLVENHHCLLQMVDDNGLTVLHHAGIGGSVDVVKYLIESGVDTTEVTKNKMSVLLLASEKCHIELVKYLVENHPSLLQTVDYDGYTSLHHAGAGGSVDMVKYLIENGLNVTEVTKHKISVLLLACQKCHIELVKYLVENHPSLLQTVDNDGCTSLHHAGAGGSVDVVKYLIESGVDTTEVTKNKMSVLHLACKKCHIELVKYLVENHPSLLQMVDDYGFTSLHHAGEGGSVGVVKYLIENGVNVKEVTNDKRSVLHIACNKCHYELVKYLVENHEGLLQMVGDNGLTVLHHAGIGGSVGVVKYLIENGVNVTEVTKDKMSVLHLACNKCHYELVKYLVENHPSLLQMVDEDGLTVLHHAGLGGSVDVVKYLIENGLSVTEVTKNKMSVLLLASEKCHIELVKYLVENHPSLLEIVDERGFTSLHHAGAGGSVDMVKYLIENGLNVTEVTKHKISVLLLACQKCHIELVKYLVENHPSLLQTVDNDGCTSLHHAGAGGSVDVVKYLIESGVDTTEVTKNKRSVLPLACQKCHIELVKYLVENHPSLLQMVDDYGFTSLHHAGEGGSVGVVKYLIENGVNVKEVTNDKRSVLHIACNKCHYELVKYLVENHEGLLQMVDDNGLTVLHHAGLGGSVDVVKYLIENGVNVTEVTKRKMSVLLLACQKCHIELVKYLVENHHCLLQTVDDNGLTGLQHAAIGGSVDVVKNLIEFGMNIEEVTLDKKSVLHLACDYCHHELVKYLVQNYGYLLKMRDDDGSTGLHFAGLGGSVDVVKCLIENGVNVKEVTNDKSSVLHIACNKGHYELVKYLVENHPSLLQMLDVNGYTVLHYAAIGGSVDVVKYLIEFGMNIEKVSLHKRSVLHLACSMCHHELVKYLVQNYGYLLKTRDDNGTTGLHYAGAGGSVDVVKCLIDTGVNVKEVTNDKWSVLHIACNKGHYEVVKYLVENHPSLLQMVNDNGLKVLHHAGIGGSVGVVKYLIENGVNVTEVTKRKMSVLLLACQKCHIELVKYLVENHPSLLEIVDESGFTSLHHAGLGGSVDVVKYLIENGVNVTEVTTDKMSVLHLACQYCHIELVKYLVENHHCLLQTVDDDGFTGLHHAAKGGSVDVVKYLIEFGMNIEEVTLDKRSVLHLACRNCHHELVKYLVQNYADLLKMRDDNGTTGLRHAGLGGSVDVVKYLIENGVNVKEVTKDKMSVLHLACNKGHYELVKYLVENHPTLLQIVSDDGLTVLHHAAIGGSVDVVKYLIEFGMNIEEVTLDKRSVLHLACRNCDHELVKYLVRNYANLLKMRDANGATGLHYACAGGSVDVVKYLIDIGMNVKEVTNDKRSVLHLACNMGHYELVKYLVENHPTLLQMVSDDGLKVLHHAAIEGSVDVVKYLIEFGMIIEEVTLDKRSVLHLACNKCHYELVKYLVENHPSLLQMVDEHGFTCLHHAAIGGSLDVVKYLIRKGVKVTDLSLDKSTVLHVASQPGHIGLVKYLVEEHHCLLHLVNKAGFTSLHYAHKGGSIPVVQYLMSKGLRDRRDILGNLSAFQLFCVYVARELSRYIDGEIIGIINNHI